MSEEIAEKKTRTRRPTNLLRATAYTTTDGTLWTDKKLAVAAQKKLDLLANFEADPIAEGVTAEDLFEYVKAHKSDFHAVLRSLVVKAE